MRIYVTHMQTKKWRENLGDISIIARRLEDGHVQYGWSGNGGYYKVVGVRLLFMVFGAGRCGISFWIGADRINWKTWKRIRRYRWLKHMTLRVTILVRLFRNEYFQ